MSGSKCEHGASHAWLIPPDPWALSKQVAPDMKAFPFVIRDRMGWEVAYVPGCDDCATAARGQFLAAAPGLAFALKRIVDLQGKLANGRPLSENELRDWAIANHNARCALREAGLDVT